MHLDRVIKPGGKPGPYAVVETYGPGVMAVALTEKNELILVRQFRYPTQMSSWEFPGGGAQGENLLSAARRELWEETGYKARTWKKLGKIQSCNSLSRELMHIYLATGLTQTGTNKKHEDGILEVKKVPLKKVMKMVKLGQITETQTLSALTLLNLK